MNIREEITAKIIAAIEAGTPPWRKGWSGGELCCNGMTLQPYRGVNQLLLGMSCHSTDQSGSVASDNRWLTFKQARKLGLHVRKGEKSTKIIRMVEVDRKTAESDKDADVVGDENGKVLIMRLYDVFNASQIEGMEPRPARDHTIQPVDMADGMIEGMKATGLSIQHGFPGACYVPDSDLIRMPEKASFFSAEAYYSTMFHEAIHATGSFKRLNRLSDARFGSPVYAHEELIAELGAAWIFAEVGAVMTSVHMQAHIENSAAYMASWLQALKNDKNEIFRAAADAQRACDYIREHAIKPQPKPVLEPEIELLQPVVARRRGLRM